MRYAVIQNGVVVNVILWDGVSDWTPPEGAQVVKSETANIGDSYDGSQFTPPASPPE